MLGRVDWAAGRSAAVVARKARRFITLNCTLCRGTLLYFARLYWPGTKLCELLTCP